MDTVPITFLRKGRRALSCPSLLSFPWSQTVQLWLTHLPNIRSLITIAYCTPSSVWRQGHNVCISSKNMFVPLSFVRSRWFPETENWMKKRREELEEKWNWTEGGGKRWNYWPFHSHGVLRNSVFTTILTLPNSYFPYSCPSATIWMCLMIEVWRKEAGEGMRKGYNWC